MENYDSRDLHVGVDADKAWRIEQHAIDPIPITDRHGTPAELFKMWIGVNTNYVVVVTGALALSQGLSLWQALMAILVGNLLGCFVLGLTSIMGPRTGTSGIMTSRSSFGQLGSFLPKAVSLVSALSWFSINSVVATLALESLLKMVGFQSQAVVWVSLTIILATETLLAIFGHATIIAAEKWIAVVLAVLFGGLAVFVLPHTSFAMASAINYGGGSVNKWLIAMGIIFACPIAWANFASDYSRYFPAHTSWKKIALAAGGGQFVSLMFCEVIGVLFAIALGGTLGDDPVSQLSRFLPTWFIVPLLFAIILSGIAANVPNGYTAGLRLLALRIPINRITSLAIIALFTLALRVVTVFYGQFFDMYQAFLNYMVLWTAPWAAIVIVDYFMRGGQYLTDRTRTTESAVSQDCRLRVRNEQREFPHDLNRITTSLHQRIESLQQTLDIGSMNIAHRRNAEQFGRQSALSRIDHEAARLQSVVQLHIRQTFRQAIRAQHHRRLIRRQHASHPARSEPHARLFGQSRITCMPRAPATFVLELAQPFNQCVVRVHGRCERRIALILQPRQTAEIQIERATRRSCERSAPHHHKRCTRHGVQTFVGRSGNSRDTFVVEVDRLRTETADAIDQKLNPAFATCRTQRLQIVQAARRGFVMNHRHVRNRAVGVEPGDDLSEVGRAHPIVCQRFVVDAVLLGDLRNALAIHTVFDDQQLAVFRHERRHHAFDCGRARARHQDRSP